MSQSTLEVSSTGQQKSTQLTSPLTLRDIINKDLAAKEHAATHGASSTCPQCTNAKSWGTSLFCPQCGWYPKIGKCVPIDQPHPSVKAEEILSVWEAWKAIPPWAWPMIIGNFAIAVVDVAIAIAFSGTSTPATIGFFQLTISALTLLPLHFYAYLKSIPDSDEIKPFDIFMKPRLVWKRTFEQLPATSVQVWVASFSICGIIFATLFLGGVNISSLLDGAEVKKKKAKPVNAMSAVSGSSSTSDSNKTMQQALNEVAGKADPNGSELASPEAVIKVSSCSVIGFTLSGGSMSKLVIAEKQQGFWVYRGDVACDSLSSYEQEKFKEAARQLMRRQPVVNAPGDAFWMTPKVMCEIEYTERTPSGRFVDAKLKQVLLK